MDFDYIENKIITFSNALATLNEALKESKTRLERDGCIQRFEYCYELAWKCAKVIIKDHGGVDVNSPKEVLKKCFVMKYISNEMLWFDMIEKRNSSVHTYNIGLANGLMDLIPSYYLEMNALLLKFKELYDIK
ncbi:MAG: nucleotidyltransferase [Bacteroidetes bacterium]|nr:MAG: nucleotidyltransferase [Bacteroidota bacterium]